MQKKWMLIIIVLAIMVANAWAQEQAENPLLVVSYMKSTPGKTSEYVKCETQVWKKIHKQLQASKGIIDWSLWAITSPRGTEVPYDYITVNVYPNWAAVEAGANYSELVKKAGLTTEELKLYNETNNLRSIVRSEVFRLEGGTENAATGAKYAAVNYMSVPEGGMQKYYSMEFNYFLPVHQEAVNNKKRVGWQIMSLLQPWGTEVGYQAVTVDFYTHIGQMYADTSPEWEKIHGKDDPNLDVAQVIAGTRTIAKGMLLTWVDGL
ncbi:MAG: hypothetical protein H6555_09525 [Lewinellaceae bacterium]|nr:hypothetical protein [Lewinellaceae bacterium]